MKKLYFSLIFLFIISNVIAQTTYIPDIIFEQALIDAGIDKDFTVNGQVANKDIENVKELDISSRQIGDLTGIEGFINLKKLDITDNIIGTINLSNNTKLESLMCGDNPATELDLTKNK